MSIDRFCIICQIARKMTEDDLDPRQLAILTAAWESFATYGYRKTSMDDIASKAGMSRPALYLHYKNKENIYRNLVSIYYAIAQAAVHEALAADGSVPEKLAAAFVAQGGERMEDMLNSPHGMELVDLTKTAAGDVVEKGEADLADVYAAWLEREHAAGRVALPGDAASLAKTMMSALKGLKTVQTDFVTYQRGVSQLAALFGAGLLVK